MAGGIGPLRLLLLRLKWVRFGNEVKLNCCSVPSRFESERFISETVRALLQVIPVQLQRFWRWVRDHEVREEDDCKLFLHLSRACASVVAEDVAFNGCEKRNRASKRRTPGFCIAFMPSFALIYKLQCYYSLSLIAER